MSKMTKAALVIESGIPLPPKAWGGKRPSIFRTLAIGDSVFFADKKVTNVSTLYVRAAKELGFKFTCRTVEGGVRVWRIA